MILSALAFGLVIVGGQQSGIEPVRPVLDFPEPGLDDTASYQGYQTRFYRDSKQNTVQIYLDPRGGRVVTLLANAANESIGFTVRDTQGRPARLSWAAAGADITDSGTARTLEYQLSLDAAHIEIGWFILGSMRVERDFVYAKRHLRPFTDPPFRVAEESLLVASLSRLPDSERNRHLALLGGASVATLRSRLGPTLAPSCTDTLCTVRVERPSLDAQNRLILELGVDPRQVKVHGIGKTVAFRTRPGASIVLRVKVSTDAAALTPLKRKEIFNQAFLRFLAGAEAAADGAGRIRYRRMERQVRGVELLSSKEKLMAGLPNFATYFGRDMMMTALMMQPVWTAGMSEHVIASVLRKLGPGGAVSHEEALGGQAIRENAVVYDSLVRHNQLPEARAILASLQKTRENYHMIDDEFQLPVLMARYLADSAVAPERKRAFLFDSSDGLGPRLALLLREMALVSVWTRPYVDDPQPIKLVSFPQRDATHWRSASWRDSDAGYAGGRFAMDVNAIWAPQALESIVSILARMESIGVRQKSLFSLAPDIDRTPLGEYLRNPALLRRALNSWRGARKHFEVALAPAEVQRRVQARLAWLPPEEQRYWQRIVAAQGFPKDSVFFLALSLDANGKPIPVVSTDPATGLFLREFADSASLLRTIDPFVHPYPLGLFVDSLGPLAANDAYAPRAVWERFRADAYHSPRVVWGREVNLLLLGLADAAGPVARDALSRTLAAVEASNLGYNELWSYRIARGRLLPVRYGTSSDVQLWNTTDLAVEFVLSGLK